jgi:predicted transcriptional regulator
LHEKKYYTKDELYCTSNYNQTKLDNALKDLEKQGLITTEGWLVRIAEMGETLMEETIVQRKKK